MRRVEFVTWDSTDIYANGTKEVNELLRQGWTVHSFSTAAVSRSSYSTYNYITVMLVLE